MRLAFLTACAVAGVATAAWAQTPPAAEPAVPAAPPAAAQPEAPPAPAAAPAPAPAPEAPTAAAPEAPAPEAKPPEPTLPTTGDGAEIVRILQNVCLPLVKGGNVDQLAPASGMKKSKKNGQIYYVVQLGAEKTYSVTLEPQGSNREVCSLTVNYAIGGEKPIISALNIWAYLHDPYMAAQRNDYVPATDFKRITNSWEYFTDHESQGLVFLQLKKPDGSPVNAKYDLANVLYSERKF